MRRVGRHAGWLAVWLAVASGAWAAEGRQPVVVAVVGSTEVYRRDVERMLRTVTGGRQVHPQARAVLEAQALAEIVSRYLALAYAERTGSGPSQAEVERAVEAYRKRIRSQGQSVEDFLAERSMTAEDLQRQARWDLTWKRFVQRYVTEARAAAYFQAHRRELDGTQLAVRHIQLELKPGADASRKAEVLRRARQIRQAILAGEISFEQAARQYSTAPSASEGGAIGWIGRHGPMVESFTQAAFALQPGEVSEPIVTPFGVHLIRVDKIKPGEKQLEDVRPEIEAALERELLERLARYERQFTPVRYTGASPYFDPESGQLVLPAEK